MIARGLRTGVITALFLMCISVLAQSNSPEAVRNGVRAYRQQHEPEIVRSFAELLAKPNLASDSANIRANAEYIAAQFKARGLQTRLLETSGAPPAVYGELSAPGAKHTIIWYAHYDGQPVDKTQWATDPWTPVLREGALDSKQVPLDSLRAPLNPEWRLYARSAGDDKAPIQALLTALDAMRANKIPLSVNLKVFFEGEEEAGSPHLEATLMQNSELLKGDVWLISDGPVNQTRRMQVFFGARGEIGVEMTLYGPARVLHDGHYGNWAPNPAAQLTSLLGRMRGPDSHILIPNFYDDVRPLTASERDALAQLPDVDTQLKKELALAWTESDGASVLAAIMQPSLNVRGLSAGNVGAKAQNAIPTTATASLDFRLVPDEKPDQVKELVEKFIQAEGYYIVHQKPDLETRRTHRRVIQLDWEEGYPASRTSMDDPAVRPVIAAIQQTLGSPIPKLPTLGGSLPMYLFTDDLKTPVMGLPIANHDNNQHAANENLRLQNLWDGIEIFAGILSGAGNDWH